MNDLTSSEVLEAAMAVFHKNHALALATAGAPEGTHSPWILGAYFASEGPDLLLFLESGGTSLANLRVTPRVAFSVSENDATRDFVQGRGEARLLASTEAERVTRAITAKMPSFKLYTPVVPVQIVTHELRVSSFARQWFPAKRWLR